MSKYLLTIVVDEKAQPVVIHGDSDGLLHLAKRLETIAISPDNLPTHDHLMTEDWGGTDLTNQKQGLGENFSLVSHLLIYRWAEELPRQSISK